MTAEKFAQLTVELWCAKQHFTELEKKFNPHAELPVFENQADQAEY